MPTHDLPPDYDFRTVEEADLPLLARWIAQHHWAQWWGDPADELMKIRKHIDSISVEPLIVELNGEPIAYLQSYDPHLEDDHPYADQPFGTLGIDLSIGPESFLSSGHDSALLVQFVADLFDEGATRIIVDPDHANLKAIDAYKKAGFKQLGERTNKYGTVLLMAHDNPENQE